MKGNVLQRALGKDNRRALFVVCALVAAAAVPFYFSDHSRAQTPTTGTLYIAGLSGPPIGNAIPHGNGRYFADNNGNRVFETEVNGINLPAGAILGVLVDGTPVGTIRLSTFHSGALRLSTGMGQTVPVVNNGSTLTVRNAQGVILAGVFGPPPTPSPFPSISPFPTPSAAFFAPLHGPTIDGIMPRGYAAYAEFGTTSRRLGVFANHVHLPEATHLGVFIDDAQVGEIILNSNGDGGLRLDTGRGDTVPIIVAGSTAEIRNSSSVVLSGVFQVPTFPSPRPSVSPTANPSPRPNRFFGGRLNGAQVVPPVSTEARGVVFVALNDTETQIRVWLGFRGLSSPQTTAKIYGPAMPGETASEIFDLGTIVGTEGRFPVHTFDVTAEQKEQLRSGLWYVQIASADHPDGEIRGQIRGRTRPSAFAGSVEDDIAVFRPSNGTWYVKNDNGYSAVELGGPGDQPVSADYDGDGKTDFAVFRSGTWLVYRSSDSGVTNRRFGLAGDIPVRGDYDGDGIADLAVFRPSTGVWYVEKSNGSGYTIVQFGLNGDRPVASDLDGDGRTDIAVFRSSNGTWYWLNSRGGSFGAVRFGSPGDIPITGDFDGDGTDDVTVWRPSTGVWYIARSTGGYDIRQFGLETDIPVAGNYDGDNVADIAVFRPSTGVWYVWKSSDGSFDYHYFGIDGDVPSSR